MALTGNLLTYNDESVETDITGWAAGGNTTIAQSTTQARDGTHSLRLTSTASGTISANTANRITGLSVSAQYTASYWLYPPVQVTAHIEVDWYTATTYISTGVGADTTAPASVWTQIGAPMTPVATTQQCIPIIVITATAGSQLYYCDEMFFGYPPEQALLNRAPAIVRSHVW
ncbi:hypothetical protein DT019_02935 [Streptomyces sp. SDr-06]|uniref:hypothetical protein n=1 Tax=Streptomyces sp. SDr-06 TaxID=2267702 RepID=UPI000DEB129D|nr:hypothetical protein [Streptomyces sp. SDr-06]RCH70458.1 hypothetical protein DT019_02935 [Streptomyces sp. SDr-06]